MGLPNTARACKPITTSMNKRSDAKHRFQIET
jgi:hypothetical protein